MLGMTLSFFHIIGNISRYSFLSQSPKTCRQPNVYSLIIVRCLILAPCNLTFLSLVNSRNQILDYLHPLSKRKGGIFVKKSSIHEGVDFRVFLRAFRDSTWIVLTFSSLTVALCIIITWKILDTHQISIKITVKIIYISFKTNFGSGSFDSFPDSGIQALNIIFLTALLMGNLIWLTYNGSLLSALITTQIMKPFEDLEELTKTNYRCLYLT